jgi:hypothetical protein
MVSLERERVRFIREADLPAAPVNTGTASVLLLGCVKTKRQEPAPAKDLYISPLFLKRRAYAASTGLPWFVLSSQWGLVHPDQILGPYDMYLPDQPAAYRKAWGEFVAEQLNVLHPLSAGAVVEIHAGSAYIDAVREPFARRGISVTSPVDASSMGETLHWYGDQPLAGDPAVPGLAAQALAALSDADHTRTPAALRLDADNLAQPGLYSWWVDANGAASLAAGLGLPIEPGLIYAGQAGATRWPSGRRSRNTLRARLIGMHLDGSVEFSTFRKTLDAILAEQVDEPSLSAWMAAHLRVAVWPTSEPDVLHSVEAAVLAALDPPLNLQGMPHSPVREALSRLRSTT